MHGPGRHRLPHVRRCIQCKLFTFVRSGRMIILVGNSRGGAVGVSSSKCASIRWTLTLTLVTVAALVVMGTPPALAVDRCNTLFVVGPTCGVLCQEGAPVSLLGVGLNGEAELDCPGGAQLDCEVDFLACFDSGVNGALVGGTCKAEVGEPVTAGCSSNGCKTMCDGGGPPKTPVASPLWLLAGGLVLMVVGGVVKVHTPIAPLLIVLLMTGAVSPAWALSPGDGARSGGLGAQQIFVERLDAKYLVTSRGGADVSTARLRVDDKGIRIDFVRHNRDRSIERSSLQAGSRSGFACHGSAPCRSTFNRNELFHRLDDVLAAAVFQPARSDDRTMLGCYRSTAYSELLLCVDERGLRHMEQRDAIIERI